MFDFRFASTLNFWYLITFREMNFFFVRSYTFAPSRSNHVYDIYLESYTISYIPKKQLRYNHRGYFWAGCAEQMVKYENATTLRMISSCAALTTCNFRAIYSVYKIIRVFRIFILLMAYQMDLTK